MTERKNSNFGALREGTLSLTEIRFSLRAASCPCHSLGFRAGGRWPVFTRMPPMRLPVHILPPLPGFGHSGWGWFCFCFHFCFRRTEESLLTKTSLPKTQELGSPGWGSDSRLLVCSATDLLVAQDKPLLQSQTCSPPGFCF